MCILSTASLLGCFHFSVQGSVEVFSILYVLHFHSCSIWTHCNSPKFLITTSEANSQNIFLEPPPLAPSWCLQTDRCIGATKVWWWNRFNASHKMQTHRQNTNNGFSISIKNKPWLTAKPKTSHSVAYHLWSRPCSEMWSLRNLLCTHVLILAWRERLMPCYGQVLLRDSTFSSCFISSDLAWVSKWSSFPSTTYFETFARLENPKIGSLLHKLVSQHQQLFWSWKMCLGSNCSDLTTLRQIFTVPTPCFSLLCAEW